jgi:hypothetical protein
MLGEVRAASTHWRISAIASSCRSQPLRAPFPASICPSASDGRMAHKSVEHLQCVIILTGSIVQPTNLTPYLVLGVAPDPWCDYRDQSGSSASSSRSLIAGHQPKLMVGIYLTPIDLDRARK